MQCQRVSVARCIQKAAPYARTTSGAFALARGRALLKRSEVRWLLKGTLHPRIKHCVLADAASL
jgi:hypothetical protein